MGQAHIERQEQREGSTEQSAKVEQRTPASESQFFPFEGGVAEISLLQHSASGTPGDG